MKHPSESAEQTTLINWFDRTYPNLRLFAIPNGGLRSITVAIKLKLEGVRPGVPDLFLPVASNGYHGLFIEIKAIKGKVSKEQVDWILFLQEQGYKAEVCYGWISASNLITEYLTTNLTSDILQSLRSPL